MTGHIIGYIATFIGGITIGAVVCYKILKNKKGLTEIDVLKEKQNVKLEKAKADEARKKIKMLKEKAELVKNENLAYNTTDLCDAIDNIEL